MGHSSISSNRRVPEPHRVGLRQWRTDPLECEGGLPAHLQRRQTLGSDPSHVCVAEAASVGENQQAGTQRQSIRSRGAALFQVPQIRAHKARVQGQAGGLQNVWPPGPLSLRVPSQHGGNAETVRKGERGSTPPASWTAESEKSRQWQTN